MAGKPPERRADDGIHSYKRILHAKKKYAKYLYIQARNTRTENVKVFTIICHSVSVLFFRLFFFSQS